MKFGVLALDYDGTIAQDGALCPDIKAAIAEARARGIVVIIATGRMLSDLRSVSGGLNFIDPVVAENGAVLAFPNGQTRILGHLPPQNFFDQLRRRGVDFRSGQCIVEADASAAPAVLAIIRDLQLPLVILFNRGRLMVLSEAISKGTGLRNALHILRLSPHNAIAIGDAENDHALLAECELAVAVSWGSEMLQAEADEVVNGHPLRSHPRQPSPRAQGASDCGRVMNDRSPMHPRAQPASVGLSTNAQAPTGLQAGSPAAQGLHALAVHAGRPHRNWAFELRLR